MSTALRRDPRALMWNLNVRTEALNERLEAQDGELDGVCERELDALDAETPEVADQVAALIKCKQADAEAAGAEAQRLQQRKARALAEADALKHALGKLLDARGETKVRTPRFTVSRTKGRLACRVTDATALPAKYVKDPPELVERVDRRAVLTALTAGEDVPGAELTRGEPGLSIR